MSDSTVALTPRSPRVSRHITADDSIRMRDSSAKSRDATAVVYCEANFGAIDGKTANGLVRHSEKYRILSVIE